MASNQHIDYEKLVQEIYQTLHEAEGIGTIKIGHNIKIEGRSGCKHQIDVYWEFEVVGQVHRVAIECKNYTRAVEIGKLRDFFGVMHDVGNIKGIFVTKTGYDSGAVKFANYYNISLQEARFPAEDDWEGRVKDINFEVTVYFPRVTERRIVFDNDWLLKNKEVMPESLAFFPSKSLEYEIVMYDSDGNKIVDMYEMENRLPRYGKEEQGRQATIQFKKDAYLDTPNVGRVKVNQIEFTYDVVGPSVSGSVRGEEVAKAILKDVKTGRINFFDKHGNVRSV
ncbi:MAG: restriction endonuclease [Acidobacteriota bacterium]|nr:restriction endonuclease [Acidobacteriota bacterium]